MSTHTPAPWAVESCPRDRGARHTIRQDGRAIADVWGVDALSARADADLIASAPDMLAALKMARKLMSDCGCAMGDPEYCATVQAIAKAEGREP